VWARRALCTWLGAWPLVGGGAQAAERPALQHSARDSAPPGKALLVRGTLVGGGPLARLVLRYRGPGRAWEELPMEREASGAFRGAVPAVAMASPGVEYYVEAVTSWGERVPVFRSAHRPARVLVIGTSPAPLEDVASATVPGTTVPGTTVPGTTGPGGATPVGPPGTVPEVSPLDLGPAVSAGRRRPWPTCRWRTSPASR
jgi:hypothetical protein